MSVDIADERRPVSIEWLVWWTYQRQRADLVIERGVGLYDQELLADGIVPSKSSPDGVYLICTTGGRVDGGGKAKGDLHPDADLVYRTIKSMGPQAQAVVRAYIRAGTYPDPMIGIVPTLQPKRDRLGRAIYQRDRRGKRICCVLEACPDQSYIDMQRRAYNEWLQVMMALAEALQRSGKLESHQVTGVSARPFL